MEKELMLLFTGLWSGMAVMGAADLGKAFRKEFPHRKIWIHLEDLGFWIFTGFFIFYIFSVFNAGVIRQYVFFGGAAGIFIYRQLFGRLCFGCAGCLFHVLRQVISVPAGEFRKGRKFLRKVCVFPLKKELKTITIGIHYGKKLKENGNDRDGGQNEQKKEI